MFHNTAPIRQPARARRLRLPKLVYAMLCLALAAAAGAPAAASAAALDPTVLVKDLNAATAPSTPSHFISVGNLLFFTAFDPQHGRELWRSDGTPGGTMLLKDIYPGVQDAGIAHLTSFKNALYFLAGNNQRPQLWRSDGTSAGTTLVYDFVNSPYESYAFDLVAVNNALFILTESQGNINNHNFIVDASLWRSDGTPQGTSRIYDFMSVPNFWIATDLTGVGNTLFLRVLTSTNQILYRSDGTTRGTFPLAHFAQSYSGLYNNVDQFTVVNTTLFFRANEVELWKSNGTTAGTLLVKTMPRPAINSVHPSLGPYPDPPDAGPRNLANVGGRLFFTSFYSGLWVTDGSAKGTQLLVPQQQVAWSPIASMRGIAFFGAGYSLWRSDGTPAGTASVAALPGLPTDLFDANGTLFFRIGASSTRRDFQLWKSDGTPSGTGALRSFSSPFIAPPALDRYETDIHSVFALANGRVYFAADDGVHGMEPWISDGTPAGTMLAKDTAAGYDSDPYGFLSSNGAVFFGANGDAGGVELWRGDGSTGGTAQVLDIDTTPAAIRIDQQIDVDGTLFFSADTGHGQAELWRSDGTSAGTLLIKLFDLASTTTPAASLQLLDAIGGTLLFNSFGSLWRSDGTPAGTVPLPELTYNPGTHPVLLNGQWFFAGCGLLRSDSNLSSIVKISDRCINKLLAFNNQLVFSVGDGPVPGVYLSDGTAAGTAPLTQFPSEPGSMVDNLASAGNRLFFRYQRANSDSELWASDGTPNGTHEVSALPPANSYFSFTNVNGRLVFAVQRKDTNWPDLWVSDGTAAGTVQAKEQFIGPYLPSLPSINGTALFATMTSSGSELWKSDGTLAGTQKIAPITAMTSGYAPAPAAFSVAQDTLLFLADSGAGNTQAWRSDGSATGTHPLIGVEVPYAASYTSAGLTLSGHHLFVLGKNGELRAIPVSAGVDEYVAVPDTAFAPAHGQGFIPIVYANRSAQAASNVTLSVTLPNGLSYAGDDSGVAPAQSGNTLTWSLPNAGLLDTRIVHVRVTTPDAPLGTRYPVAIAISAATPDAAPANNTASTALQLARDLFLPLTVRPCVYTYNCNEPL